MTKFQRFATTVLIIALIGAIGMALHELNQTRDARAEAKALQAEQDSLTKEVSDLQTSLAILKNQLANVQEENSRLKTNSNEAELLNLRDELTRLRSLPDDIATLQNKLKQSSATLATWKTNDLADVGRGTPIDALRSFAYASQFAHEKMRNSFVSDDVDPPSEEALQKFIKDEIEHHSLIIDMNIAGYKILSQSSLAPDKLRMDLEVMASEEIGISVPFTLRKVNGEWKVVVFNVRNEYGAITGQAIVNKSPFR